MIAIIDYGVGNLRSVEKAFAKIGVAAFVTDKAEDLVRATHIVLPGVGAFKDAIDRLNASGLAATIRSQVAQGKPFLGICLGMQMLMDTSTEDGLHKGLGLLDGDIIKFDIDLKVPHIGWNKLSPVEGSVLYKGIGDMYFYFVHSYHLAVTNRHMSASCEYGIKFAASVECGNVFGVQFHPEKSGDTGLRMLKNFADIKVSV